MHESVRETLVKEKEIRPGRMIQRVFLKEVGDELILEEQVGCETMVNPNRGRL